MNLSLKISSLTTHCQARKPEFLLYNHHDPCDFYSARQYSRSPLQADQGEVLPSSWGKESEAPKGESTPLLTVLVRGIRGGRGTALSSPAEQEELKGRVETKGWGVDG